MRSRGVGQSDIGRTRQSNEDCFAIDEAAGVYIVCDGVGGHASGERASALAARTVLASLRDPPDRMKQLRSTVFDAIQQACRIVHREATDKPEHAGMSTTLTMVVMKETRALMAHVGDSRLYLFRNGTLSKLSIDHTFAQELVRGGVMTREKAEKHPHARALSRVIGMQDHVTPELFEFDILPEDTLLLCSDGLVRGLEEDTELNEYLAQEELESIPMRLIDLANARGGGDNITVLAIRPVVEEAKRETAQNWSARFAATAGALDSVTLFQDLSTLETARVIRFVRTREAVPGETILTEGSDVPGLFTVIEGRVSITRKGKELTQLGRKRSFGEGSLAGPVKARCTVTVIEPTRYLVLERAGFETLLLRRPLLGIKLLQRLSLQIHRRLDRISADLHALDAEKVVEDVEPPIWI